MLLLVSVVSGAHALLFAAQRFDANVGLAVVQYGGGHVLDEGAEQI